jgi:hypothetical protein
MYGLENSTYGLLVEVQDVEAVLELEELLSVRSVDPVSVEKGQILMLIASALTYPR